MTPTEKQLKELFDRKYGTDKELRAKKLQCEIQELNLALYFYTPNETNPDDHVKD